MKKFLYLILFLIVGYVIYSWINKRYYFVLEKSNFSDIDEFDTIEAHPEKGLYFLNLIRNGALGHFSCDLGIVKQDLLNPKNCIKYEFDNNGKAFRISENHIAFIKSFGITNYGWFHIRNGKMMPDVPSVY